MAEQKINLKVVGLTALVSGALTVAGGFQMYKDKEYRESLKTSEVIEFRDIASNISNSCWVNDNQDLYLSQSQRYMQLLEDEVTRNNINELKEIETGPAPSYTFLLAISGYVFFLSGVLTLGETIERTGRFIQRKVKSLYDCDKGF